MTGLELGAAALAFLAGSSLGVTAMILSRRRVAAALSLSTEAELRAENAAERVEAASLAEAALRETESRYELALRAANDGVFDVDLARGKLFASSRLKEIFGISDSADLRAVDTWTSLIAPEDLAPVRETVMALLNGDTASIRMDYRVSRPDGYLRWVTTNAIAVHEDGHPIRVVGAVSDITERRRAERQLMHDAVHDKLTGLPNRLHFVAVIADAIEEMTRHDRPFAVFNIAIDRLRHVNEDMGHAAGDQLLVAMGHRLREASGDGLVARLGGDEFGVLVERVEDAVDIRRIGDLLTQAVCRPLEIQGRELFLTASIGIAVHRGGARRGEDILADAQLATQRAKEMGKARVQFYDTSLRRAFHGGLLTLGSELHHGVARDEFELHYQPIWRLATRELAGFEALIRWRHPRRGLIGPHEFISLSEETGLIETLGRWCVAEACRQLAEWQAELVQARDLFVTVNVSARQLISESLVEDVSRILETTGLDPSHLKLEVTESLVMADPEHAAAMLERFHARGIRLAIDDFGTGYSSLSHLQRFPFETLKIDRSFIARLGDSQSDAIVGAIIQLAKGLSMQVVAEGVETASQAAILKEARCDLAQGFYFSTPRPAGQLREMMVAGMVLPA